MLLLYIAYRYARLKAKNRHPYRKCLVMIRRGSLWLAFEKNLSQCLNRRVRSRSEGQKTPRQRRNATTEPNEALSSVPASDTQEAILREAEREQMLRDTLSELPPRCLELVGMLFFQEPPIPYEEVAKNLTLAKGSIGFIRMRCLKRLRQLLVKKGFQ